MVYRFPAILIFLLLTKDINAFKDDDRNISAYPKKFILVLNMSLSLVVCFPRKHLFVKMLYLIVRQFVTASQHDVLTLQKMYLHVTNIPLLGIGISQHIIINITCDTSLCTVLVL